MILKKILFPLILFLLISCTKKEKQIDNLKESILKYDDNKNSKSESKNKFEKQDFKNYVAEFAQKYTPSGSESLDSIPIDVIKAFKELRTFDKDAHENYITLFCTKLYAEHLQCCHQSFIIEHFPKHNSEYDFENLTMVNDFAFISSYLDKDDLPEIWTSGIIEK